MSSEWAPLCEAIVGRPDYRIVSPFPETWRGRLGERSWQALKRQEGQRLSDAFPRLHRRLREQMEQAAEVLRDEGVRVHIVPAFAPGEEGRGTDPSTIGAMQCFPRDPLLQVGPRLIELALVNPLRRAERLPLRRLLTRHRARLGLELVRMPSSRASDGASLFLEGGDCLQNADEIYVGISGSASNRAGIEWLQTTQADRARIVPVELQAGFPHLDLAMALVRPGLGVLCPQALPRGPPPSLSAWQWIEIDPDTALRQLAANLLPLNERTTLVAAEAETLAAQLRARGQRVRVTPFAGVAWLGGGLRCWCQPLHQASPSQGSTAGPAYTPNKGAL